MCKVIAICNQKGGVSKTTTTVNLGVGMVREEKRVLVIVPIHRETFPKVWVLKIRTNWR